MAKPGKQSKKVKKKLSPSIKKKPRIDSSIKGTLSENPVWQTGIIDLDGPWGWREIQDGFFFNKILPKIQNFESMCWHDILGRNNHEVKVEKISNEAQKRLIELKLDDFETLVSLRLTGPQRVWGVKIGNVFKILWWDPEHKVYPSKLRHT